MRNIFIIIIFCSVMIACCNSKKVVNFSAPDGFYTDALIEGYYSNYYKYPENMSDFIFFLNSYEYPKDFEKVLNFFKENEKDINIIIKDSTILIVYEKDTIYGGGLRTPCNELDYNILFYLERYLLFNKKNKSTNNEDIKMELQSELKTIKYNYAKVEEGNNPDSFMPYKYLILEYEKNKGLSSFCKDDVILENYPYLDEVEKFLEEFTNEHELGKVIFTTPIFYN